MSNKSSKALPTNLKGKVIVVSATLPGAGKSYVRKFWARQLKRLGYQVWNLGTTNKVSDECTVTKKFGTFVKDSKVFKYKTPCTAKGGKHKTRAFVLIDEAFMLQKGHLIDLVTYYPECCFILFGDPLQFDPVTTYVLEGDNEELLLQQQAYDEAIGVMINKADLVIDIQGSHRFSKDSGLFKMLQEIRRGIIDTKFVMNFMNDHLADHIDYEEPHVIIPFTKQACQMYNLNAKEANGYKLYRATKTRFGLKGEKVWAKGDIFEFVDFMGIEMFRNIETGKILEIPDEDGLFEDCHSNQNFELANAVNAHKLQGATIGKQTIYIPLADICRYVSNNKDKTWTWFQKYLYVALSRATDDDQVQFLLEGCNTTVLDCLINCLNVGFDLMKNQLLEESVKVADSSDLLIDDVVGYLETLVSDNRSYENECPFIEAVKRADFGKAHKAHKAHIDLRYIIQALTDAGFTRTSKGIQKYCQETKLLSTASFQKHKQEILDNLKQ